MSGRDTPPETSEVNISLVGLTLDDFTFDKKRSEKEQAIIEGGDQDELERFRQEWRAEVKGRRRIDGTSFVPQASTLRSAGKVSEARASPVLEFRPATSPQKSTKSPIAATTSLPDSTFGRSPSKTNAAEAGPSRVKARPQQTAVELYAEAVENEQSGQLNDALMLYRKAFKIDGKYFLADGDGPS